MKSISVFTKEMFVVSVGLVVGIIAVIIAAAQGGFESGDGMLAIPLMVLLVITVPVTIISGIFDILKNKKSQEEIQQKKQRPPYIILAVLVAIFLLILANS